ncbi:MAG: ISL3 family transposase [Nitrospirota bacterium]
MGKSITSLLKIQGWFKILDLREEKHTIHLFLKPMRKTAVCPRCLKRTKRGYDEQPERTILHTTIGEQLLYLHIAPRRFLCSCTPGRPFVEKLAGVTGRRRSTTRFDTDLLEHLRGQSFKTVESKLALSYPALRARLESAVDPARLKWELLEDLPEIHLGLDGHHLVNKKFVQTVTEVKARIPLGILPGTKKSIILAGLTSCPEQLKEKVKSINVDMDDGTIAIAQKVFPNAVIVIDKFHVVMDANQRLNEARLIEQEVQNQTRGKQGKGRIDIPIQLMRLAREHLHEWEKEELENIFKKYPMLKIWYVAKEKLREIYRAKTREEAEKQLNSLILILSVNDDVELIRWGRSLKYYKEKILNYFCYRTTNAYTEGLHVRCKLVQRLSCGFRNADVYIRKALLMLLPLSVIVSEKLYPQYLS